MRDRLLTFEMLEEAFEIRDEQIERIRRATETRRKMAQAKSQEEIDKISLPNEFAKFGDYGYHAMSSYISGFSLVDKDAPKCFYGAMGSQISLLVPTLFRGEIKDYSKTSGCSSLGREISIKDKDDQEKYLSLLVAQMRIEIFAGFLSHFKQFRDFPFAKPRPELIAQHYGLSTQFLDLTDDIKVAMFFACCKNMGGNIFRKITEDDINEMGEYGVLFIGIADVPCIGCQPFCRCHRQRGYYLDTAGKGNCWDYSLARDNNFNKFYFKRSVALSERLYEEFQGGETLFPPDTLSLFDNQVKKIKQAKVFPILVFEDRFKAFLKYLDRLYRTGLITNDLYCSLCNKSYVRSHLQTQGIKFQEKTPIILSEEQYRLLQSNNDNWNPAKFEEDENIVYTPLIVRDV